MPSKSFSRIRRVLAHRRQDRADLRRAQAQAIAWEIPQPVGEARSRTSRAAHPLQKPGGARLRKFSTFLRLEICVNRLKDLRLNKGLENLPALRNQLVAATARLADFQADLLNVHVDFPLFQRLALPVALGKSKIPGIKIQDTRMIDSWKPCSMAARN
jgi:hypothetical protein